MEITQLKAQINHLQQRPATTAITAPTLDFAALGKLAQGFRQALAITPTERQAKANIAQLQQLWDRDRTALQLQLSRAKADNQALSTTTNSQKNLLMEAKSHAAVLQEKMSTQHQLMQTNLDNAIKDLANARANSAALQARSPWLITGDALRATQPREDYAAGVSLGEEILQMQEERRRWGVASDKQMILAGIADTFAGKRMLADDELNKILAAAEKR